MSFENDNTTYKLVCAGPFETGSIIFNVIDDGWTEDFFLQLAEALAGLTYPDGCSLQVQKQVDVLTTYTADTAVSPAVFD